MKLKNIDESGSLTYSCLSAPFTNEEIARCIRTLKRRKAVGPDEIPAEFYKRNEEILSKYITEIINVIFQGNYDLPRTWTEGVLCTLNKKKTKNISAIITDQ